MPLAAPRFLVDAMLGRLARWLRVLGYDAELDATLPDPELVRRAAEEDRVLLTRDRHLLRELRPVRALEVHGDAPLDQLRMVVDALGLDVHGERFTRCLVDNTPLELVNDAETDTLVPPNAREVGGPVRRCPSCGRVYWPGSHARRMLATLARTFG